MTTSNQIADNDGQEGNSIAMEVTDREAPSLLISEDYWFHKYLIYSLTENRLSHLNIPEFLGRRVVVTSYGWLVLIEPESLECCLFNPKSKDKIQLPQVEESYGRCNNPCILTKLPTEPDCYVVFIDSFHLYFCRIGGDEFTTVPFGCCGSVVSFQGQIYGFDRGIVTIHFVGKTAEFRPVQIDMMHGEPKPWFRSPRYYTWLIESCGEGEDEAELLMVHKIFLTTVENRIDFRVCRVDPVRRTCEELVNIGDRTIFLNDLGVGFCCCPASGIKPNSIYYFRESCDRNFHVFNLENGSITSMPFPPNSVRRGSFTAWVDKKIFFS